MATLSERLVALVKAEAGKTDRELTDRLVGRGAPQQSVNQAARALEAAGQIQRQRRSDGRIGNYFGDGSPKTTRVRATPAPAGSNAFLAEDDVKQAVRQWLESDGWEVTVVLGRGHGTDIAARRKQERWVIEAKGQGSVPPMRVNYFLCVLGELLQRMDDPEARYSIALPDLPQYRGLWQRLPSLAKARTRASALFVTISGHVEEVS